MKFQLLAGLAVASFLTSPIECGAIIMRHDVNEARYRDLGEQFRQQLVQLALPSSDTHEPMLYSGMGTLIAPDWVVTAAHAATYMQSQPATAPGGARYVFVKGRAYRIKRIVVHPGYREDAGDNDIALIQLEHAVREPQPACLYEKSDESGQIVYLAGTGLAGDGVKGPGVPDGALRGATVRVDTANGGVLTWMFRKPGDPKTTPLEGISGPGDSGGPAFIRSGGKVCIAGISSRQRFEIKGKPPQGSGDTPGEGLYGATEIYTRVSQYLPWIRATMAAR